mmetsp:Transcript_2485/g.6191  ORF Transcript_2485/g.6191 Transcript_2485/m.6191 type:complete len:356 (+) Transcript_2485:2318-3385(+)
MNSRSGDAILIFPSHLHLREIFLCEIAVLVEVPPEVIPVATPTKEVQVCLAYGNVVRRGARVQLLVPLLDEFALDARPMSFLDAIVSHDVQDSHSDVVSSSATSREVPHQKAEEAAGFIAARGGERNLARQNLTNVHHVLCLVVVPFVQWQRARFSHPNPREERSCTSLSHASILVSRRDDLTDRLVRSAVSLEVVHVAVALHASEFLDESRTLHMCAERCNERHAVVGVHPLLVPATWLDDDRDERRDFVLIPYGVRGNDDAERQRRSRGNAVAEGYGTIGQRDVFWRYLPVVAPLLGDCPVRGKVAGIFAVRVCDFDCDERVVCVDGLDVDAHVDGTPLDGLGELDRAYFTRL